MTTGSTEFNVTNLTSYQLLVMNSMVAACRLAIQSQN